MILYREKITLRVFLKSSLITTILLKKSKKNKYIWLNL